MTKLLGELRWMSPRSLAWSAREVGHRLPATGGFRTLPGSSSRGLVKLWCRSARHLRAIVTAADARAAVVESPEQ